jgi:hypothetical protein
MVRSVVCVFVLALVVVSARRVQADQCICAVDGHPEACGTNPCRLFTPLFPNDGNCTTPLQQNPLDETGCPWNCPCDAGQVCSPQDPGHFGGTCCVPFTCAQLPPGNLPGSCGTLTDDCGGTINCPCPSGQVCATNATLDSQCCTPNTCKFGACGTVFDGCNSTIDCGGCPLQREVCNASTHTCVAAPPSPVPAVPRFGFYAMGVGLLAIGGWLLSRRKYR